MISNICHLFFSLKNSNFMILFIISFGISTLTTVTPARHCKYTFIFLFKIHLSLFDIYFISYLFFLFALNCFGEPDGDSNPTKSAQIPFNITRRSCGWQTQQLVKDGQLTHATMRELHSMVKQYLLQTDSRCLPLLLTSVV
jgi:hypothetical protein